LKAAVPFLLLTLMIAGCDHPAPTAPSAASPSPLPAVEIAHPQYQTLTEQLPATGTLAVPTADTATVTPAVSGMLSQLTMHLGQQVHAGQVIAQISTAQLQGQLLQAQAALGQGQVQVHQTEANTLLQQAQTRAEILQARSALSAAKAKEAGASAILTGDQAAVQTAKENLARETTLFHDGLVAQKDVADALLSLETAQSAAEAQKQEVNAQAQEVTGERQALSAAQAATLQISVKRQDVLAARQQVINAEGELSTVSAEQSLYTLHAPLSGTVTQIGVSVGETVGPTSQIAVIENLNRLELDIALPGNVAQKVSAGQKVFFTTPSLPGQNFQTSIYSISPQVDPKTGTLTALAFFPNVTHALPAESSAKVDIIIKKAPQALIVPLSALLTDSGTGETSVVVITANDIVSVRKVKTGLVSNGKVQIIQGLSPDDFVAVSGEYGLADGTKVKIVEASGNGD
jgi:HlyD family secretion protein